MSKKLTDLKTEENLKLLVMGMSGSGKTVFSCSFPGPIWLADFDNKVSSAARYYSGNTDKMNQIEYESYSTVDSKGTSYEKFNNDLIDIKKRVVAGEIKTVVIDSMTTFGNELMNYLIRINPHIKRPEAKGAILTCQQDYQMFYSNIKVNVGVLLAFPCNVVFTAHIKTEKDDVTGELHRMPMFPGRMAAEFPTYFEEVYRAYVKDGKHFLQTRTDQKFTCRTQIRGIPNEIPMHYDELIKQR